MNNLNNKLEIIDAHHHIWRLSDLAWLNGRTQPRIFGDYDSIKRDYPIEEFVDDVISQGVVASVYIQVNWPDGGEVAEAAWVQEIAENYGWPNAIIGYVDFSSEKCAETLRSLSQFSLMRGIRQQLHWHQNPLYRFAADPDIMMDYKWQKNFALLQDYDFSFELQVFAAQMQNAANLAIKFPGIPFVLQHCGMPEDLTVKGMAAWFNGMKLLSDQPNVYCKFSGLGTFLRKNSKELINDITGQCVELFGPNRCIYGSNFPIEKIWTSYSELISSFISSLSGLSQHDQELIFCLNAKELYKIEF